MIVDALFAIAGFVDRLLGWQRPAWGHPFDDELAARADEVEDRWALRQGIVRFSPHEAAELLDGDIERSSPRR